MLNINNFEAVIFDMDGVLIDSEPLWKVAMQETFQELGSNLTKSDFQQTVGLRLDEVIRFWHAHESWKGVEPKAVEERIVQRMIELLQKHGEPLTGVIETLDYLKSLNLKIGLATSSYSILIETVLNVLKINDAFHVTHSAEHEGYGKPHPAVYLHVAKELNVNPLKCLVIEDSLNGIVSGKAARMKVACIPEKSHHPEPKLNLADFHFESMDAFLASIKSNL